MVATYKKYNLQNLGYRDENLTWEKLGVNYTPFGVVQEGRNWEGTVNSTPVSAYRFGFNGMEKDNEVKGSGNSYTTPFRQYDPRLGRWLTIDPLWQKRPFESVYAGFGNNPIYFADPSGLTPTNGGDDKKGNNNDLDEFETKGKTPKWMKKIADKTNMSSVKKAIDYYQTKNNVQGVPNTRKAHREVKRYAKERFMQPPLASGILADDYGVYSSDPRVQMAYGQTNSTSRALDEDGSYGVYETFDVMAKAAQPAVVGITIIGDLKIGSNGKLYTNGWNGGSRARITTRHVYAEAMRIFHLKEVIRRGPIIGLVADGWTFYHYGFAKDGYTLGYNSLREGTAIAAGNAAGYYGAGYGAAVGTAVFPGPGTIGGGIMGYIIFNGAAQAAVHRVYSYYESGLNRGGLEEDYLNYNKE